MKPNPPRAVLNRAARLHERYKAAQALQAERDQAILEAVEAGWSQTEVAARLGTTQPKISQRIAAARRAESLGSEEEENRS